MNTEPERIATTDVLEISAHGSGCLGGGQWCQLTAQRPGPPSGLSNGVWPQQSCPHQRKGTTTKRQQRGRRRQEGEGAQGRGPTSNRRLRPAWSTCQTVRGRAPGARRLAREGNSLNGKPTVEKGCEWKAEERREGGTPWTRRGLACSFSLARRRGVQRKEIQPQTRPGHTSAVFTDTAKDRRSECHLARWHRRNRLPSSPAVPFAGPTQGQTTGGAGLSREPLGGEMQTRVGYVCA